MTADPVTAGRPNAIELQRLYGRYARLGIFDVCVGFTLVGKRSRSRRRLVSALQVNPGDRVLDLACGTGLGFATLLPALESQGSIVGVDLTAAMLRRAEKRIERNGWPNIELRQGDAEQLPFEDHSFSAVCSTLALSLVPDWRAAIRECWRVLEPGGRLAVIDVAPLGGWRRALSPVFNPINHLTSGWKPPGPDLIGAFAQLSPLTGMERLPPLGIWMLLWAQKPPEGAEEASGVVACTPCVSERSPIPQVTGHI